MQRCCPRAFWRTFSQSYCTEFRRAEASGKLCKLQVRCSNLPSAGPTTYGEFSLSSLHFVSASKVACSHQTANTRYATQSRSAPKDDSSSRSTFAFLSFIRISFRGERCIPASRIVAPSACGSERPCSKTGSDHAFRQWAAKHECPSSFWVRVGVQHAATGHGPAAGLAPGAS